MPTRTYHKVNDLSDSPLWKRFEKKEFVPETNYAVGMGRVSTKKQKGAAHHSDQIQLDDINQYVERMKLILVQPIWDVAETAVWHERRKNFLQMIEYVEASQETGKPVKHVVFSHSSRSSRNRKSKRMLEELMDLGVAIHFARDDFVITNRSDLGTYLRWLVAAVKDEEYIEDHRQNVWKGMLARVEEGVFPGRAPFGYRNFRPSEKEESVFVLVEGPAAYMRRAFELCSTGRYSIEALKLELDRLFPHLTKTPDSKRLGQLLRNPFFCGDIIFAGEYGHGDPAKHPPLVSRDLWQRVQDVLDKPERSKRKVTNHQHPYLGLIKCGGHILDHAGNETDKLCGCAVTGEEKRKVLADGSTKLYYYWHCTSTRNCSQGNRAYMRRRGRKVSTAQEELESEFEQIFAPLNFTPDVCRWMQNVLLQEHEEKSGEHRKHVTALQGRATMLQAWINQAYQDKLRGKVTEEFWRERNDEYCRELEAVRTKIKSLDDDKQEYIQKGVEVIELVQHFETTYRNATPEKKRKLVEIVSSNHVLANGTLRFDYRKPFDILVASEGKKNWWS